MKNDRGGRKRRQSLLHEKGRQHWLPVYMSEVSAVTKVHLKGSPVSN